MELNWHKSSYSGNHGGNCVEVAEGPETFVRDTQHREAGLVSVTAPEWSALLHAVRS